MAKLDVTGHRWLSALVSYDFDIHYKHGRNNQDVDGLSKRPQGPQHDEQEFLEFQEQLERLRARFIGDNTEECAATSIRGICQAHHVVPHQSSYATAVATANVTHVGSSTSSSTDDGVEQVTLLESITDSADSISPTLPQGQGSLCARTPVDWVKVQMEDPHLLSVIQYLMLDVRPSRQEVKPMPVETTLLLRQLDKLTIRSQVLYCRVSGHNNQEL
jgi:hypothetical protein